MLKILLQQIHLSLSFKIWVVGICLPTKWIHIKVLFIWRHVTHFPSSKSLHWRCPWRRSGRVRARSFLIWTKGTGILGWISSGPSTWGINGCHWNGCRLLLVLHRRLWAKQLYFRGCHNKMGRLGRWISSSPSLPNFSILVSKAFNVCLKTPKIPLVKVHFRKQSRKLINNHKQGVQFPWRGKKRAKKSTELKL